MQIETQSPAAGNYEKYQSMTRLYGKQGNYLPVPLGLWISRRLVFLFVFLDEDDPHRSPTSRRPVQVSRHALDPIMRHVLLLCAPPL